MLIATNEAGEIVDIRIVHRSAAGTVEYQHIDVVPGGQGKPPSVAMRPIPGHVRQAVEWAAGQLGQARSANLRAQLREHAGVPEDRLDAVIAAIDQAKREG